MDKDGKRYNNMAATDTVAAGYHVREMMCERKCLC
jgi:hypothetical protein